MQRWAGLVFFGLVSLMFSLNLAWFFVNYELMRPLERNQEAPAFELPTLNRRSVQLKEFRGKVVMLDFWATWCERCLDSLPYLERLADTYSGVQVLAVNVGESFAHVKRFARKAQLRIPVLVDEEGKVAELYGVRTLPFTVIIDRNGIIRRVAVGPRGEEELQVLIAPFL